MSQVKIVVSAPLTHADAVRKALGDSGAGRAGNYTHCSFSTRGYGRFTPQEGAQPYLGEVGKPEMVEEELIEVVCDASIVKQAVEAMLGAHPYEEPMYDLYALIQLDDL